MEYTKLGRTDIEISKVCVGCMSFGKAGTMHDWTLDEGATEEVVKHALDVGHQLLRHGQRLFCRDQRGISGPGFKEERQPGQGGHRVQSLLSLGGGTPHPEDLDGGHPAQPDGPGGHGQV